MSRKNPSNLPALLYHASKLPWWLSVLLAIASGWYLHSVAVGPVAVDARHFDQMLIGSAFKGMATFGQFFVPLMFIGGAIASVAGRRKRRRLLEPDDAVSREVEPHREACSVPEPVLAAEVAQPVVAQPKAKAPPQPKPVPTPPAAPKAPACPHCKKQMVIKVARTGPNAGGNFWGCGDYPKCRGIRAIFAPVRVK